MPVVAVRGGYSRVAVERMGAGAVIDRLDALPERITALAPTGDQISSKSPPAS